MMISPAHPVRFCSNIQPLIVPSRRAIRSMWSSTPERQMRSKEGVFCSTFRLAAVTAVVSAVFAALAFWVWLQVPAAGAAYESDDSRIATLIIGAAMGAKFVFQPDKDMDISVTPLVDLKDVDPLWKIDWENT